MEEILALLLFPVLLSFYLIPAINAILRKHSNKNPIAWTNLFFGWTFIGWIICLIWSTTDNISKQESNKK